MYIITDKIPAPSKKSVCSKEGFDPFSPSKDRRTENPAAGMTSITTPSDYLSSHMTSVTTPTHCNSGGEYILQWIPMNVSGR